MNKVQLYPQAQRNTRTDWKTRQARYNLGLAVINFTSHELIRKSSRNNHISRIFTIEHTVSLKLPTKQYKTHDTLEW